LADFHALAFLANSNIPLSDAQTGNRNQLYRIYNSRQVNSTAAADLPTSFIICNQHAREVITGELCFWLIRLLGLDSGLLLEWPEMQTALRKSRVTARLATAGVVTRVRMNKFISGLLTRMKVEVRQSLGWWCLYISICGQCCQPAAKRIDSCGGNSVSMSSE
jgi:hypothetical protein